MRTDAVLKNVRIDGALTDLTVRGGVIAAIGRTDAPGEDCGGARLLPGMVDVHTHGLAGLDAMDGDFPALARAYAAVGTTSFLATTMTAPAARLTELTRLAVDPDQGARLLGVHWEGPYLSPDACGAQNPADLAVPSAGCIPPLPGIRMVTLAPELPGALDLIRSLPAGTVASLGHTRATYEQTLAALDAGANCLTHVCNAMPPFLHRAPGPIAAAYLREGTYIQVISDGVHLHPATVLALWRAFGSERMILISDSMRATGLADGIYDLGGQNMTVKDGIARTPDGALAGSTTPLLDCVRHAISFGIPEGDAVRMATETPARLLGIPKGKIAVGYDADLLLVDDNYCLLKTLVLSR